MTDRIQSLTVALVLDMREDDVAALVAAIECIRGVAGVTTNVVDPGDYTARVRIGNELRALLWEVLETVKP